MTKFSWKKSLPHLIAIPLFLLLPIIYFSPVLENQQLSQHDSKTYIGMSKEIVDYNKKSDDLALWTNSMFGGMPSYLIGLPTYTAITSVYNITNLFHWRPISFIFLYLIGFYIALLLFGVSPWLAIVGSLAFGFGSYNFIIIAAGHASKAVAIGYMAPVIAGFYYAFKKDKWIGGSVFAIFLALEIYANHPQIAYYTFLILLIMGITELIYAITEKQLSEFLKKSVIIFAFALLAVAANTSRLWTTWEYGKYSLRGKSELTNDKANKTTGLDRDYATGWSYGIGETFTLLIPNFNGGSSAVGFSQDSETGKVLKSNNIPNANTLVKQLPGYWGSQPGTSGPVYFGAIICFLFVLGLFLLKGTVRIWVVVATLLSIALAWGHNFMPFTNLFLDYFPGYNKFRTVTMILVIAGFTFPLYAILTLQKIVNGEIDRKTWIKPLAWSVGLTAGIALIIAMIPSVAGSFISPADSQFPDWLQKSLIADREALLQADAIRSAIFILLGAGLIWALVEKKLKVNTAILILGALILIDMWEVDKRYLNDASFVSDRESKNPYKATVADIEILKDKTIDYRVLNMAVDPFADASTSYFHQSIGGYHGAKMRRYQELIDFHISNEMALIAQRFQKIKSQEGMDSLFLGLNSLNMLNTKYFIYNPQAAPVLNRHALGSVWLVDKYKLVENADQEIAAVKLIDPAKEVVVDKKFQEQLSGVTLTNDSNARISLTAYSPNKMTYHYQGNGNQLAVFSAIYYPKGWNAYIDGKIVSHFQANYVLRSMLLQKGNYDIVFRFEPTSFLTGQKISFCSSLILLLLIAGLLTKKFFLPEKK
ncbi:MAG: YfhO family protein [Bacteroidia bacterium]|nr:YfhO family protein [Bacteroidia bacterium]